MVVLAVAVLLAVVARPVVVAACLLPFGFAWREILAFITANLGNYLLSLVVFLVAHVASQLGFLLCCVGVFIQLFRLDGV